MSVDIISEIAIRLGIETDGLANDVKGTTKIISELTNEFKYLDKAMYGSMNEIERLENIVKTLNAKLKVSNNLFEESQKTIKNTQNVIDKLIQEKKQLNSENEEEAKKIKEIDEQLEEYNKTLSSAMNAAARMGTQIQNTEKQLEKYENTLKNTKNGLEIFSKAADELGKDMKELAQDMNFNIDTADFKTLQNAISELRRESKNLSPELKQSMDDFTQLKNKSSSLRQEIEKLGDEVQQTNKKFDMSLAVDAVGEISDIVGDVSRNIVDFSKESVLAFSDFETTVVGAVMKTDNGLQDLDYSMSKLMELGAKFPITNTELAVSFDDLAAAGYDAQKSMEILEGSLSVSIAVGEDLEDVVNATSSAYALMSDKVDNITHLQNIMAKGANLGKVSFEDLGKQVTKTGGNANLLGMSFEELVAIIAELTNEGFTAEAAGEKLNSMLNRLASPTKNAKALLEELNVKIYDSNGNFRGFTTIMNDLAKATEGYSEQQKTSALNTIFSADVQSIAASFMEKGIENTNAYTEALKNCDEYVSTLMNTIKEETAFDEIEEFRGAIDSLQMAIGEALLPVIKDLLPKLTELVQKFIDLPDSTKETIVKLTLVAGIFGTVLSALAPLLISIMSLQRIFADTKAATTLINILGRVGGAFGGLGNSIFAFINNPVTLIIAAITMIVTYLGTNIDALNWLMDSWGTTGTVIAGILEVLTGIVQLSIGNILILLKTLGEMMIAVFTGKLNQIDDIWKAGWAEIEINTTKATSNIAANTVAALDIIKNRTKEDLDNVYKTFDVALTNLDNLTYDNAEEIATSFTENLKTLDNESIRILRGTSDTMDVLFGGIKEDMSDDEANKKFTENLQNMALSSKYSMDNIVEDIEKAMGTIDKNVTDGTERLKTNSEKIFNEMSQVGKIGIDNMSNNVVSSLSNMDVNSIEQLTIMGGKWSKLFNGLVDENGQKIERFDQAVRYRIKKMSEENPDYIEDMKEEMDEYFAQIEDGAAEGLDNTNETIATKGEELKGTGAKVGSETKDEIVKNIKDSSKEEGLLNSVKDTITNSKLENTAETTGLKTGTKLKDSIKTGSNGSEQTVEGIKNQITQLDNVKLGTVTKQLSEVNKWLTTVSTASKTTRTNLQNLTNLPFGNTTKGLSEINKWLKTVSSSAKSLSSSLKTLTSISYVPSTRGLSEINKWLKTVKTSSQNTKNSLKSITDVTYGKVTLGFSEINKWLINVKSSASSVYSYLSSISRVRFTSTISSLNSLRTALINVANQASVTKSKVSSVNRRSIDVQQISNPEISTLDNNPEISTFNENLIVAKNTQDDIFGIFSEKLKLDVSSSNIQIVKALNEQNRLLNTLIDENRQLKENNNSEELNTLIDLQKELNSKTEKLVNKDNNVYFDGRELARKLSPYKSEIDKYDMRNPRYSY